MGLPAWVKSRGNDVHNYFVFVEEIVTQVGAGTGACGCWWRPGFRGREAGQGVVEEFAAVW